MQKNIILTAQMLGFFRAKDPEQQNLIFEEMLELAEFQDHQATVSAVLEGELLRRHVQYQNRAAKTVDRIIANAAKPLTAGALSATDHINHMPPGKYVLTTAQNNTDVCPVFFESLRNYCVSNNATLLVAKTTYNLNGFQETPEGVYYDPLIVPYLVEGQINLGGTIEFCSQANVLPTAKNPLASFEGITGVGVSVIIPATKIALKCTAALKGGKAKELYSTGAITRRNYIMRKAGAVAATEHNIGALFVDTTGANYVARHLELMAGSDGFFDENVYYTADSCTYGVSPEVMHFGDIHAEKMEEKNLNKMLELLERYQPKHVLLHDVMDFSSRNHHNIKDCAFMFNQSMLSRTIRQDIVHVGRVIKSLAEYGGIVHIVESNHDLAINTYLKNQDFKEDPVNAVLYLDCMLALYKHVEEEGNTDFNMLEYVFDKYSTSVYRGNILFHSMDESLVLAGVECGCHGHVGSNGARGGPAQFRALGIPINTGHTHTPSIMGGCYTAGVTGSLEMGYNVGASSWRLANVVIWPNGQRQVLFM